MSIAVCLTKLSENVNALRTKAVEGECLQLPQVGKPFFMTAPSLDPEGYRREITTTIVKTVDQNTTGNRFLFVTKNTTYLLQLI